MSVRTRFAPSPTGDLHIGGVRTALFSWLHARKHRGQFILRIEDTDRERSSQASVDVILESMAWLDLEPDEAPYYQSKRLDRYHEAIGQLLDQGSAYYCYCTKEELEARKQAQIARGENPRYDRRCRENSAPRPGIHPVVRFKTPLDGSVLVDDLIQGRVRISNEELDDLIIARSDGSPTYNFTVVVDDSDMGITDVIRGDDHLNNTPRQIHIFEALGVAVPRFAHVPMILGADGKRLSKRHGAGSVLEYRKQGFLPEALLNYLVRLGWSHGDQEIFSREALIELFDVGDVNKAASVFNSEKLEWLNQHYIKTNDIEVTAQRARPFFEARGLALDAGPPLARVVEIQRERAKTLVEMLDKSEYFYRDFEGFDEKAARKHLGVEAAAVLDGVCARLRDLDPWTAEGIHAAIEATCEAHDVGFGKLAQPLRVAVTGATVSPPIDMTLALVGRARTLERIERAVDYARRAAGDAA